MAVKGIQYRNQTALHEWLTKKTFDFLCNMVTQRGIVWRQEHTIHNGMRPDAIAFCSLQSQYYNQITGRPYPRDGEIKRRIHEKGFSFDNFDQEEYLKIRDICLNEYYDNIDNEFLIVFETKISYSDFKSSFNGDGKWKEQPYAHFHFLVCPAGFSKTYDLSTMPDYWGVLEPNPRALKIIRLPKHHKIERLFFLEAAYTILFKWGRELNLLERELLSTNRDQNIDREF
jgi:hypothetical protein